MLYIGIAAVVLVIIIIIAKTSKRKAAEKAAVAADAERRRKHEEAMRKADEEIRKKKAAEAAAEAEAKKRADAKEAAIQAAIAKAPGSERFRVDGYPDKWGGKVLGITEFTPISKKQFIAFDTETTGFSDSDDEIIEIAAVRVVNGVITDEYSQLINPGCSVPAEASAVNHITDDMLRGMPKIYEVLPSFLAFVGDDVIAAHNASFDAKFLAQACMRNRFKAPEVYFDTMALARYYPDAENKKLGTLLACAGIENEKAHRALGDARAVALLIIHTNEIRKKK